jgi:hypothetical protein
MERHEAYEIFIELYSYIVTALSRMSGDQQFLSDSTHVRGFLRAVTASDFIVAAVVLCEVMAIIRPLSAGLQAVSHDLVGAI